MGKNSCQLCATNQREPTLLKIINMIENREDVLWFDRGEHFAGRNRNPNNLAKTIFRIEKNTLKMLSSKCEAMLCTQRVILFFCIWPLNFVCRPVVHKSVSLQIKYVIVTFLNFVFMSLKNIKLIFVRKMQKNFKCLLYHE